MNRKNFDSDAFFQNINQQNSNIENNVLKEGLILVNDDDNKN